MPFVPAFSVMILHDPYFHKITFSINTGHGELSFVFGKFDIFVVIFLRGWQGQWEQTMTLSCYIKSKDISLPSEPMK
jgi:hypothetical protein